MDLKTLKEKAEDMHARFQQTVEHARELSEQHQQTIANANALKGACSILDQLITDETKAQADADAAAAAKVAEIVRTAVPAAVETEVKEG